VSSADGIPAGYRRLELPAPDPLAAAIEHGGSVYWLRLTEKGPVCDQWRFALDRRAAGQRDSPRLDGRLVRQELYVDYDGKKKRASHPMHYQPASDGKPAELHLETLQFDGRQMFKCDCEYHYTLLHAEAGELELMGRPLPENVVAYDPRDAERWFLSPKQCETARVEVARTIEEDGTMAPRVGLHAVVSSFGL